MKPIRQVDPYHLALFILTLLIFFPALGSRDFWAPVEPRYAEIARVMFTRSEWIVPRVNGQLYTDKPILYFWCVLILSKIFGGVSEWTVRLPAACGAMGTVLMTYSLGKFFFSGRIGFIAAAVLATSARVIWEGRWAHVDMLFMFCFTTAMLCSARAIFRNTSRSAVAGASVAMALAVLTKGLIGIVLPGLIIVSFILIRRDWRLLADLRIPLAGAVFLIVAAPWFVAVNRTSGGQWLRDFIWIHHIQRYTEGAGHREPVYYYFKTLPLDFLPWTLLAIPALLRRRKLFVWPTEPVKVFLFLWFLTVFLFFSFSDTKRDLYLLPLFPPMAAWLAIYIDEAIAGPNGAGVLWRIVLGAVFASLAIVCLALPVAAWFYRRDAITAIWPFAVVTAACSLFVVYFASRGSLRGASASVGVTMTAGMFAFSMWFVPYLEQYKSPRTVAAAVRRYVPATAPLYIYADTMNDFNFYTRRETIPVLASPSVVRRLRARTGDAYLLIKERDFDRVALDRAPEITARLGVHGRMWYLLKLS
ncbi:MAG TPA: glycosyltransferase family 39 protein [Candidatus Binatia bacterium]